MKPFLRLLALSVATGTLLAPAGNARSQLLITGNTRRSLSTRPVKPSPTLRAKDTVSIIDIEDPKERGSSPICP
ncbi:MAG: hypothetical protein QOJ56_5804 [Mycobacterium sp.]|nr:hypothetical protein [Mycobacterium sp.]